MWQSLRIAARTRPGCRGRRDGRRASGLVRRSLELPGDLFKLSDPQENRGNQVTARELLDSGAKRLQAGLQDQPRRRQRCCRRSGRSTTAWDRYTEAVAILTESLTLQPQSHDKTHIATLVAGGSARSGAGDLKGAEACSEALHPIAKRFRRRQPGIRPISLAFGWLRYRQTRFAEAKELYNRSLNILEIAGAPSTDVSALLDDWHRCTQTAAMDIGQANLRTRIWRSIGVSWATMHPRGHAPE